MNRALIDLRSVDFDYDGHGVLRDVDLALHAGERLGVSGPIGSGKTTLLHLVVGLLRPARGTVRVFDTTRTTEADFREVRRRVGLVFQDPDDQLFCPTVLEDVAFGPLNLGADAESAKRMARGALDRVGLHGVEARVTRRLSGGEKRLVALATVLAMEPDVLLLDEPTPSLDRPTVDRITRVLTDLPQAMIVVSHEPDFLARLATRSAHLQDGRLRAGG